MKASIAFAESGLAPDFLTRLGIRHLLRSRLARERSADTAPEKIIEQMRQGPLAVATDTANDQHYEVPAGFFEHMLGPALKYSCALYDDGAASLDEAEQDMLALTADRAALADGMDILELGCGWGSLTLYMAEHYPGARITAVSNSRDQKAFIEQRARERGLENIRVITCDMNSFDIDACFDRVVSIEMFEHMRNYQLLFDRIAGWLRPGGKLFFHIFCHRDTPYFFSNDSNGDWMARHFFTGGVMPSLELPLAFQQDLAMDEIWQVNGNNYARTCRDWLANLDARRSKAISALASAGNPEPAELQYNRWRMFVMACQELFAYKDGKEWFVAHYLFSRNP